MVQVTSVTALDSSTYRCGRGDRAAEWGSGGRWFESSRPDSERACDALTCVTSPFIMHLRTPLAYPFGNTAHGVTIQTPQEERLLDDQGRGTET